MGALYPRDLDGNAGDASRSTDVDEQWAAGPAHEAEAAPQQDGLMVIDANGQVGTFDPRLIANAERTLQLNQRFGRTWQVSDGTLDRMKIEQDLRRAIERGEFEVYLQPQADVVSNEVVGAEALVRWHHPERGVVLPEEFIPIAEESGLIVQIGEQVLRAACRQAVARRRVGARPVRIAVNLSAVEFHRPNLVGAVEAALGEAGLDPSMLELEITESTAMSHAALAGQVMRDLVSLGVKLSLDDFGTGYSSLQYLKDFPIDALKIDRSFVSGVTAGPKDAAIVATIIGIGHSLGLKVIAEGIETNGQLSFLRERGCEWYQGFLLGRPMPAGAFDSMLTRQAA
jgi:EAL domain-containing protein (putative c-di-GMP-specific phosphodiesterase class I)